MKKAIVLTLAVLLALGSLTACDPTKILHCDHCGKEVSVKLSSNMEEDWIIYCAQCNEELFADDPLLGNG